MAFKALQGTPGPWIELELPFTVEPIQKLDKFLQEAIEPKQAYEDLKNKEPEVDNPITLPREDHLIDSESSSIAKVNSILYDVPGQGE